MPAISEFSAITLAGGIELFATAVAMRKSSDLFEQLTDAAADDHPFWRMLLAEWRGHPNSNSAADIHGTRRLEFFRLRTAKDKTSLKFDLFLERFCRSMKQQGFPTGFANALCKVVDEMADNVIQHSGQLAEGFSGIAGYHVEHHYATFAVSDVGRGILATLRESPEWNHLSTTREALRAILLQGASSRSAQGAGEGFKQLFASLIDRNSVIRLRTENSALMVAEGLNAREGGELASPFLPGVQVSVSCAVAKRAAENEIKIDY
jgi:anti-sigma regulatory factor (Ser/Thr protein kinase)